MTEAIKLRPHNATEMIRRLSETRDIEDSASSLERQGYDPLFILTFINLYYLIQNPEQLIEILPDEDIAHDAMCQNCTTKRVEDQCDVPLYPGRIGKDTFESLRYGLQTGLATVAELKEKKEWFGPHFRI
jgi:hypothetical protein